jgi:phenylpyruvate tautomerase PptA (4-oxalocrotonate tautomerase family)
LIKENVMPYLSVNTSENISSVQKEKLKSEIGRIIALIPGKSEEVTMVDLCGGRSLYMAGAAIPCAYVDVKVYTRADPEGKKRFAREMFNLLEQELGIKKDHVYLSITEFDHWGDHGDYR